jgi:mannitol-1-phosphate 5-dehydrogenase
VQQYLTEEQRVFMDQHVGFLDCEVDCIVPPQDNEELTDVSVERDYEWTVETVDAKGELIIDGMTAVGELEPFLERKLYTLNGAFAFSSHLGWVYGLEISNDAAAHPGVVGYTKKFISECEELLIKDHPSFDPHEVHEYGARSYTRMVNPYVIDSVFRHGRDPIRKLASDERIVAPLMKLKAHGMDYSAHATAVAAALAYDYPGDEQAIKIQERIAKEGVEALLLPLTTIEPDSEEGRSILSEYKRIIALKTELARKEG